MIAQLFLPALFAFFLNRNLKAFFFYSISLALSKKTFEYFSSQIIGYLKKKEKILLRRALGAIRIRELHLELKKC